MKWKMPLSLLIWWLNTIETPGAEPHEKYQEILIMIVLVDSIICNRACISINDGFVWSVVAMIKDKRPICLDQFTLHIHMVLFLL